jgi:hypothetical protein
MNFVGTGKRLAQGDFGDAARSIGMETAALLAFVEVEAAGRGFDNANRPKMLRETHVFYRELGPGAKRDEAQRVGLANKSWVRNYKSDSYPDLQRMIKIDQNAALRSCSWGLPQILGNNCKTAGFADAESMVRAMMQGEREQLIAMVTLLKAWRIPEMLAGKDLTNPDSWRAVVSRYNGEAYEVNKYHIKCATAYRKHKVGTVTPMKPAVTGAVLLNIGTKGEAVRNMQSDLAALGYEFKNGIDGRYGPETVANVKAFQVARSLAVDGIAGPTTLAAISKAVKALEDDKSPVPTDWKRSGNNWLVDLLDAIAKALGASK